MSSESDAFNHTATETYRAGTMACEYTAGTAQSEKGSSEHHRRGSKVAIKPKAGT